MLACVTTARDRTRCSNRDSLGLVVVEASREREKREGVSFAMRETEGALGAKGMREKKGDHDWETEGGGGWRFFN